MENTKELRQNWHIKEKETEWKYTREAIRANSECRIRGLRAEYAQHIETLTSDFNRRKKELLEKLEADIFQEKEYVKKAMMVQAREEDAYMHQFRCYVASLEKCEQQAWTKEGGEQ